MFLKGELDLFVQTRVDAVCAVCAVCVNSSYPRMPTLCKRSYSAFSASFSVGFEAGSFAVGFLLLRAATPLAVRSFQVVQTGFLSYTKNCEPDFCGYLSLNIALLSTLLRGSAAA